MTRPSTATACGTLTGHDPVTLWSLVNPGYGPIALNEGVGGSLDAYLASLAAGFRFNTRKTDRFFQENTGPTLADDVGEAIGLALDQRTWGGQSLAAVLAAATELRGGGSVGLAGAATAATYNTGTGAGTATRVDVTNQSYVRIPGLTVGRTYRVLLDNTGANALDVRTAAFNSGVYISATGGASRDFFFLATDTFFDITASVNGATVSFTVQLVKLVPGNHGLQATGTLKPLRQTSGAKFDGSDDNWLMGHVAAAGGNFIQTRTTVPASLAGTQIIGGALSASANRFWLAINASGLACGGVGNNSSTTIVGVSDLRSTEADIALSCDGSTVRLIVNGVVEYEAAQSGNPTTTIPFRIGAVNNNGTAGNFYGGAVQDIAGGTDFLTLSRFNQIRAAMAANQ